MRYRPKIRAGKKIKKGILKTKLPFTIQHICSLRLSYICRSVGNRPYTGDAPGMFDQLVNGMPMGYCARRGVYYSILTLNYPCKYHCLHVHFQENGPAATLLAFSRTLTIHFSLYNYTKTYLAHVTNI